MNKDKGMNFPYYSLRQYDKISVEGIYRVIDTFYGRYILDYANHSSSQLLAERRLELRLSILPHKLYNLERRCDNIAQMLMDKHNVFIDCYGNIKKVRKPNRYKLLCCPVVSAVELGYKRYGISFLLNNTVEYMVHHEVTPFIQVLQLKTGWLFYDSIMEKVPDTIRGL